MLQRQINLFSSYLLFWREIESMHLAVNNSFIRNTFTIENNTIYMMQQCLRKSRKERFQKAVF